MELLGAFIELTCSCWPDCPPYKESTSIWPDLYSLVTPLALCLRQHGGHGAVVEAPRSMIEIKVHKRKRGQSFLKFAL